MTLEELFGKYNIVYIDEGQDVSYIAADPQKYFEFFVLQNFSHLFCKRF